MKQVVQPAGQLPLHVEHTPAQPVQAPLKRPLPDDREGVNVIKPVLIIADAAAR